MAVALFVRVCLGVRVCWVVGFVDFGEVGFELMGCRSRLWRMRRWRMIELGRRGIVGTNRGKRREVGGDVL